MGFGYYGWWDPTYYLVIIGVLISLFASARVKATFSKYAHCRSMAGITGAQAAERILHMAGIYDVTIRHIPGNLSDHYDPGNKTLNLSDSVYRSDSVAAVGVAAHECGHAIQHQKHYVAHTFYPRGDCPGSQSGIYAGLAAYLDGDVFFSGHRDHADPGRDPLFFVCSYISACYASGGVQCLKARTFHSGQYRDVKF